MLDAENVNVIVVNWKKGANPRFDYGQATANTRVVGAQIALLIENLKVNSFDVLFFCCLHSTLQSYFFTVLLFTSTKLHCTSKNGICSHICSRRGNLPEV